MSHRIDKINSLIKEQVADILLTSIDREHFQLVTVTRVITARDLSTAKVYVSLPNNSFKNFYEWSKGNLYDIQKELNHRLNLHHVPRISFVEDTTGEYVSHIEDLFAKIRKDEEKGNQVSPGTNSTGRS